MSWLTETAAGDTDSDRVLGLLPHVAKRKAELWDRIWSEGTVDPVLLELCRLRIAMLHDSAADLAERSAAAVAAGLTEDQVAALGSYAAAPEFTEQQRRCLAFAEQYTMDVHGISDADFAAVAGTMSAAEMTAFTFALGMFDGLTRFRAILGVEPDREES